MRVLTTMRVHLQARLLAGQRGCVGVASYRTHNPPVVGSIPTRPTLSDLGRRAQRRPQSGQGDGLKSTPG